VGDAYHQGQGEPFNVSALLLKTIFKPQHLVSDNFLINFGGFQFVLSKQAFDN